MTNEISDKLTAEDLNFPTFNNSHTAMNLESYDSKGNKKIIDVPLYQIVQAGVLSCSPMLLLGDTRCGKSLAMMDIHRNYFGGDSDNNGHSNWNVARNDFTANSYFMTIDQSKVGEGKDYKLNEARVPVKQRVESLCNNMDELNLMIPEMQVEAFGMAEGRHNDIPLGKEGYSLFLSSCNINKNNGDFSGISQINRALLNRIPITIDFDTFNATDEDRNVMEAKGVTGRLELASIRDLSEKILSAYKEIKSNSSKIEPWFNAYLRIFSSGLDYCNFDSDHFKKSVWPSRCGNCKSTKKDLCSLVKQSATGTAASMKRFAGGINYIVELNHGQDVKIDPMSLALECFKFTTYHGNLNKSIISSKYFGEDQGLMRDVIKKLKDSIKPLKPYIDMAIESAINGNPTTEFICINNDGKEITNIFSEKLKKNLNSLSKNKNISYKIIDPFNDKIDGKSFEETNGFRMNWFKGYLDFISNCYKQNKGEE